MKTYILHLSVAAALVAATAEAHNGRRYAVSLDGNQLAVQGYISTGNDDQGGTPRPYFNALHDHWNNLGGVAVADLPGFGVLPTAEAVDHGVMSTASALSDSSLSLQLIGAYKWDSPTPAGPVSLLPLTMGDPQITIEHSSLLQPAISTTTFNTTGPDTLLLTSMVDGVAGATDLDLFYEIDATPVGVIYALEWILSANKPGITDSQSIYTLLSPDPDPNNIGTPNGMLGLHHASLHLEQHLGLPLSVPEPASLATLAGGLLMVFASRSKFA